MSGKVYRAATGIALVVTLAGFAYSEWMSRNSFDILHKAIQHEETGNGVGAAELQKAIEMGESPPAGDLGVTTSGWTLVQMEMADFLRGAWYHRIPAVFAVCWIGAWV